MGAFGGSITVRRFRVRGEAPADLRDRAARDLEVRAHLPIDPRGDEERSSGWAVAGDPFDTEFTGEKVFFDDWLIVTVRVDSLRIPRSQLAPILRERLQAHEAEHGAPPDRRTRKRIETEVKRVLRQRVLPTVRAYDLAWNTREGLVLFWATSEKLTEEMLDLFETTFDRGLEPLGPSALAAESAKSKADKKALAELRPTRQFVEGFFA